MPNDGIQLVCFDLGEVLIRLSGSWSAACAAAGVRADAARMDEKMHAQFIKLVMHNEIGALDHAGFAAAVGALTNIAPHHVTTVFRAWLQGPYPGVHDLLGELQHQPIQTACLSNTNTLHWKQMTSPADRNYLPLDVMDYRFASHLIGERKPDAAIYEYVERATGLRGEAILFFDNKHDNVRAAAQRGWRGIEIDPSGDTADQMRHALEVHGVL